MRQGMIAAADVQTVLAFSASPIAAGAAAVGDLKPSRPHPWRTAVVVSMALHTAVGAWSLFGIAGRSASHRSDNGAIAVELAPAPAAPAAPPKQQSPGPEKVRSVERQVPVPQPRIPPPPEAPMATNPEVALAAKPPTPPPDRPMLKRTEDETTAPSAIPAPLHPQTAAPVLGASVATGAAQTWEASLLAKLERNKRYPGTSQSRGEQDEVYVSMTLNRAGRLLNATIVRSRGFPLLDGEVLSLVRRASPYGAPPATEAGDPISIVVPVNFFVTNSR